MDMRASFLVSDWLERDLAAADGDDLRRGAGGHLDEREALEDADIADRLAVQARGGEAGDQVGSLDALVAPGGRDQLHVDGAVAHGLDVTRLRVAARTRLRDRGRPDVRALHPRGDRRRRVAL